MVMMVERPVGGPSLEIDLLIEQASPISIHSTTQISLRHLNCGACSNTIPTQQHSNTAFFIHAV